MDSTPLVNQPSSQVSLDFIDERQPDFVVQKIGGNFCV